MFPQLPIFIVQQHFLVECFKQSAQQKLLCTSASLLRTNVNRFIYEKVARFQERLRYIYDGKKKYKVVH